VDEHSPDPGTIWGCFLSKFDSAGNYQWVRTWGGAFDSINFDGFYGVAIYGVDEIYVTGHYVGTVDFDPGDGIDWHGSYGETDIFLSKFNSVGDFQWAKTWGGIYGYHYNNALIESGNGVAVNSNGEVFIAGVFGKTVDFDPDPVGVEEHTTSGSYAGFLSKFDASGNFKWVRVWDGGAKAVAVDGENMIYIVGREAGGSGLRKYNNNGDLLWSEAWSLAAYAFDLGVDTTGNISVSGCFNTSVDFDPDPYSVVPGNADGYGDLYLSRFDNTGDLLWVRVWGSPSENDHSYAVAVTDSGISYIAGAFTSEEIDLDPGPGTDIHKKQSLYGGIDTLLVKVMQNGYW
jgi:hypothetical protein